MWPPALRRDRQGQRGGGVVALYVHPRCQRFKLVQTTTAKYELLCVRVGDTVIGAVYHPPRPLYSTDSVLNCIETCCSTDERVSIGGYYAYRRGDFNQLLNDCQLYTIAYAGADATNHYGGLLHMLQTSSFYVPVTLQISTSWSAASAHLTSL